MAVLRLDWSNVALTVIIVLVHKAACFTISERLSYTRSCSSGYYLQIKNATWYCKTSLKSVTVTATVNSKCNYNIACTLYATTSWLGSDPCPGSTKYFEWSDACNSIWGSWGYWSACPVDCTAHILDRHRPCVKPNGGCGAPPTDYIACKRLGCYSSSEISKRTPDNKVYYSLTTDCFVATARTSVAFRAMANNDLHIALGSENSSTCGTHYEIIIGGLNNTQSTISFDIDGNTCVNQSGTFLSQTYFDDFWFSWTGNYVRVGTGSSPGSDTFMSFHHLTPYTVNFILIKTGWGSSGEWKFPNDVACKHVKNSYVSITTDDTSCNGTSSYACNSGYKQVAGNTQRTCGFGGILSGYPLVCSVSTCKIDIVFIIEASVYTSLIHLALMKAIGDLAGSLKISTSDILVGAITFGNTIDLNIALRDYNNASTLDSSITSIPMPSTASAVNLAEALRFGFYDFFTLSKGNRFTAFRHFVVIAKTYSSQTGAIVADQIRLNLRNQLFTVGISPSASLSNDLKAIAGDDSRYLQVSTPDDLYPQFNVLLKNIAVCPDVTVEYATVDCELDIVFIVERYNLRYTKKFLLELIDNISISSDVIRVGMVLFDSRASTVFTLDAFNSSESVRSAIESISETNQIYHLVDKGLIEARDNVFTAARGDRMNASNYYVFIVGPFESYPEAVAKDIRRNGSNSIFAIHIGNQYQTEYQKAVDTCGDYTKYTNVGSYEKLINIKNDILQKITSCEPVNTTNKLVLDCPLDIVFIMEDTEEVSAVNFRSMKRFFGNLVSCMVIGDSAIKVGVVTYADGATTAFPLNQYSTANGVFMGITNINQGSSAYNRSSRYIDKALKYTQMEFFTTLNGDRSNAANYYILLAQGPSAENKAAAFGSAIRSIDSSDLFIVDIGSGYGNEYRRIAGNSSNYFFASSFFNLSYIELTVKEAITKCPVSKTTTRDSLRVSTEVQQTPFLVTFMSGATAGIGVTSFAIIFAIILRRFFQQKQKENVHREDNDRDRTSYNIRHSTDPAPPNDSQYTERDTITMTPDNNIALNTTNPQRDTELTNPPSDNPYLEPIPTQMTQTSNIPG